MVDNDDGDGKLIFWLLLIVGIVLSVVSAYRPSVDSGEKVWLTFRNGSSVGVMSLSLDKLREVVASDVSSSWFDNRVPLRDRMILLETDKHVFLASGSDDIMRFLLNGSLVNQTVVRGDS